MSSHVNDMTVGRPATAILRFAVPLVLGYVLQQMYMVADAAIVGRFVGVEALAAVGASSSIMFLVMGFCGGTTAGFAIPVAQAFGAKDQERMQRFVAGALRLTAVMAVALTVVTSLLVDPILRLVSTPDAIMGDARTFLLMQFLAIPLTMAYNLLAAFIRALGNSRQPFYFLIAASLLNIGLDLLFIPVLGMGVLGVGLATMLAQAFSVLLCWQYIVRRLPELGLLKRQPAASGTLAVLMKCGLPMGLQFSITAVGIIMLQGANNALGTSYVAAFTTSMRVKYLFTCVFENIGVAMATYCGQNIGAGKLNRVTAGLRAAVKIMLVYFLFTFAVIFPLADQMMMVFVDANQVFIVSEAARFMRICNWFYPVLGVLTILRYSIQGLGFAGLSMLSGVMEMVARTAVSLWMVPAWGFTGVIMGDPVAWMAADLFLVPCMWMLYRHLKTNTEFNYGR